MTDIEPAALLTDAQRAGIYRIRQEELPGLTAAAATLGFALLRVDLSAVHDKKSLLQILADALDFPPDFGHNWDALADSLGDFSWHPAPGYLLLLEHFDTLRGVAARELDTLLDVLDEAVLSHAQAGVPFWTMLPTVQD